MRMILIIAAALCAGAPAAGEDGDPAGAVVFTGNAHWPPYQFINDEGKPDGFSVDLARALFRQMEVAGEIRLLPGWAEAQDEVGAGRAAAVVGFEATPWREDAFDFSRPIATIRCVIAVGTAERGIHSLPDLYGTSVAAVSDSPAYAAYAEDPRLNVVPVRGELEGLRRLVANEVKGFIGDELSIRYAVERNRIEGVRIVGRPLWEMDYVIGARAGAAEFLGRVNDGLAAIERRGEIDALMTKWFGAEIRVEVLPPWVKWAAGVGIAFIALVGTAFIIMLVFNERLQAEVKGRTLALEQANEELRASASRYRSLVEQIPAVTYIAAADEASTTLYVSPQIEALIGFTREEYQADPDIWRKRLHPADAERVLREVAASRAGGRPFASEYRMIARDGSIVRVRDEARFLRGPDGRPVCLQGVMHTISERREADGPPPAVEADGGR
ncbi:MAG: transporter substrate-binding domain-containing protein [bacterium]|nr:transporter substrate-binding domain-containing protein [bacterium]